MSRAVFGAFALTCLISGACSRAPVLDSPEPDSSGRSETVTRRGRPPENPLGFASRPLAARALDYVLVPSKSALDAAIDRGFEAQTFVYLGAHLEEVFEKESRVRWLTAERALVPNALIVPLRRGERAAPGQVVLTSWAAGSGLQRALVIPGGSPESPKVRYLDLPVEGPIAPEADRLAPNTFHVLTQPGEVGSSLACANAGRRERSLVINRAGNQALCLGFAGKLRVVDTRECVPLPLEPRVAAGDRVLVPHLGDFVPAEVESVDATAGRVLARFTIAGEARRAAVGYTNVFVP